MKLMSRFLWGCYKLLALGLLGVHAYMEMSAVGAGTKTFSSALYNIAVVLLFAWVLIGPIGRSAWKKFCKWDPFAGIEADRRRFNARWNAAMAQKRAADRKAAQDAQARYEATNKAAWHEYYAKQYAGTKDGFYHQNMAWKYRNEAR